eukprot:scaffold213229_cov18-Tisochrysis_lutea.AAC.1
MFGMEQTLCLIRECAMGFMPGSSLSMLESRASNKKGGEDPEITYVPLPPRQAAPAPAPPMQAPPQAHATATAPTTPTTVGSGGIPIKRLRHQPPLLFQTPLKLPHPHPALVEDGGGVSTACSYISSHPSSAHKILYLRKGVLYLRKGTISLLSALREE